MSISTTTNQILVETKRILDQKFKNLKTFSDLRIKNINRTVAIIDQYLSEPLASLDDSQREAVAEVDSVFKKVLGEGRENLVARKTIAEGIKAAISRFRPTNYLELFTLCFLITEQIEILEIQSRTFQNDWQKIEGKINSTIQRVNQVSNFQFKKICDLYRS